MRKILIFCITLILLFFIGGGSDAIAQQKAPAPARGKNPEKALFSKKRTSVKIKEPRAVVQKKKEQEKKEAKRKKEYNDFVKAGRKRTYQIQSPEVKERMKQNSKEIAAREKTRKKKEKSATGKARQKYR